MFETNEKVQAKPPSTMLIAAGSTTLADPKSDISMCIFSSSRMFSGFKSLKINHQVFSEDITFQQKYVAVGTIQTGQRSKNDVLVNFCSQ